MHFIQSSVSWDYLYSPTSWLHKHKSITKFGITVTYLICLPYISIKQIYYSFIIFFIIYNSIYIPVTITSYIVKMFNLFILFLLMSIQNQKQVLTEWNLARDYLYCSNPINYFVKKDTNKIEQNEFFSQDYYIPMSLIRLLLINFLYLTSMKILLLTTTYKNILDCCLSHLKRYHSLFIKKLIFETQISVQFLKIIVKQIEVIKIAYLIRSIKLKREIFFHVNFYIYFFCIQQFIQNTCNNIHAISRTIYNNEINTKNLNFMYYK